MMLIQKKYLLLISIFLCTTHLNFGMDKNCFISFFGSENASQQHQVLFRTLAKKIGYTKPIQLKVMNETTENRIDEKAVAFVSPNITNTIYINPKKFDQLSHQEKLKAATHEIYHLFFRHPQHRKWEKESWLTMLQGAIPPLAISCLPGIPKAIHKKLLTLGASLFCGSMAKGIYLDNSSWYKGIVQKWYNHQERQAEQKTENFFVQKK